MRETLAITLLLFVGIGCRVKHVNEIRFFGSCNELYTAFSALNYSCRESPGELTVQFENKGKLSQDARLIDENFDLFSKWDRTEGMLDFAILGPGYFGVQDTTHGRILLSRTGPFMIDASNFICAKNGYRLMNLEAIPSNAVNVSVRSNGDVYANTKDISSRNCKTIYLGRICIYTPPLETPRTTDGPSFPFEGSEYSSTESLQHIDTQYYRVCQGYIENADLISPNLPDIETQRNELHKIVNSQRRMRSQNSYESNPGRRR